ncbi:hypothetical protein [Mangrovibacterium lignilyticum]|uniref:hypothetical protein n=1 Tax=Mangrovibacterium lignilyticum TaxID=2668052 RepID=UPI0013CFCF19|nr:hypothetical protein [Mangrovibacterium lignilyticum]
MRQLLGFIFLVFAATTTFSQIKKENIDTICVKDKTLNYENVTRKQRTYTLIKNEIPDSLLTFTYLKNIYPNGTYRFSMTKGTFNLISAPGDDSTIQCVDTVDIKINDLPETVYKYEPKDAIIDGEGCLIFSKKYGIIASSSYSHRVKRLVTDWNGIKLELDTLLNYRDINLFEDNKSVEQPPSN